MCSHATIVKSIAKYQPMDSLTVAERAALSQARHDYLGEAMARYLDSCDELGIAS